MSFPIWVAIACLLGSLASFASLVPNQRLQGHSLSRLMRTSFLPVLPLEIVAAAIAGATAHAYYTAGFGAIVALGALMLVLGWLLDLLSRGERRREALDGMLREREELAARLDSVEERARRALAAELHDDALQKLAAARQVLTGDSERERRLQAGLDAAEASLREVVLRFGSFEEDTPAAARLRELTSVIGDRAGLSIGLIIDPALEDYADETLVGCARELLVNVEKHAKATRAWVTVRADADLIRLTVTDNGRGGRVSISNAVDNGHVGLALITVRAEQRGGQLTLQQRPEGGTIARVDLRRLEDARSPVRKGST